MFRLLGKFKEKMFVQQKKKYLGKILMKEKTFLIQNLYFNFHDESTCLCKEEIIMLFTIFFAIY